MTNRRNFLAWTLISSVSSTLPSPAFAADDNKDKKKTRYVLDDETGDYVEVIDETDWQTEWKSRYNQMQTMSKDEIFAAARGAGNIDTKDLANESPASKKRRAFSGCRDSGTRAKLNIDEKSCTKRVLDGDVDFVLRATTPVQQQQPTAVAAATAQPPPPPAAVPTTIPSESSPVETLSSTPSATLDEAAELEAAKAKIAEMESRISRNGEMSKF